MVIFHSYVNVYQSVDVEHPAFVADCLGFSQKIMLVFTMLVTPG